MKAFWLEQKVFNLDARNVCTKMVDQWLVCPFFFWNSHCQEQLHTKEWKPPFFFQQPGPAAKHTKQDASRFSGSKSDFESLNAFFCAMSVLACGSGLVSALRLLAAAAQQGHQEAWRKHRQQQERKGAVHSKNRKGEASDSSNKQNEAISAFEMAFARASATNEECGIGLSNAFGTKNSSSRFLRLSLQSSNAPSKRRSF